MDMKRGGCKIIKCGLGWLRSTYTLNYTSCESIHTHIKKTSRSSSKSKPTYIGLPFLQFPCMVSLSEVPRSSYHLGDRSVQFLNLFDSLEYIRISYLAAVSWNIPVFELRDPMLHVLDGLLPRENDAAFYPSVPFTLQIHADVGVVTGILL